MEKINLKKLLRNLYSPSVKEPSLVEVPAMNFLMTDGRGDPNGSKTFQAAAEALFQLSYALKYMVKRGPLAIDYAVMPLEGLWWSDDILSFLQDDKSAWKWTLMIAQPDFVTPEMLGKARAEVQKKRKGLSTPALRFEALDEGTCAQIMHVGPYSAEGPTVAGLHAFITASGLAPAGKHHEIYLSDVNKTDPDKLRTVIRQPVRQQP